MVKNTKKAATKGEQSILNFFPRAPASLEASDSASRVTRSRASTATSSQTQAASSPRKPLVAALQSSSASNCRADSSVPLGSGPRKPMESHHHKATQIQTRSVSMKRPHSPDVARSSNSASRSAENKPSVPRRDTPRKKARVSSPGDTSQVSTPSVIPSSQSDESELSRLSTPVTSASQVFVKETVKQWRKQALPPTPEPGDNSEPMDVDEERTLWSPSRPNTPGDVQEAVSASSHILTPPYTDKSSDADDMPAVPPTPVALDSDTKTAQLIAQIRAQAAADAAVRSSPELDPNVVPELSDSDDDDDELAKPLFAVLAKTTSTASASASTSTAPQPQLRRSTRQRTSLGASSTGSPVSRRSRQSLSHELDSSEDESPRPRQPLPRARARPNPIAALLKDKQKEERVGGGSAALFAAELSLKGKGLMIEEMSLEDDDLDYDNLKNCERAPSSFSFASDYNPSDDVFLDDEDRKKLFGLDKEEDGDQINAILKDDQEARIEEAKKADRLREGVPLWTAEVDTMAVDDHAFIPIFASAGNSPTLQMLSQAVQTRDFVQATTILKSGAFTNLSSVNHPEVMNDLCVLATSSSLYDAPISGAAYNAALKLLSPSSPKPGSCKISPSFVIRVLLELGASPGYLESLSLRPVGEVHALEVDSTMREAVLYRTVALVARAAASKRIVPDEIPSLVLALSLVAMDPSTSQDLRRDIMVAMNDICRSIPLFNDSDRDAESVVASGLVALSETYQPVNKAKLLSLFSGGTGATMRIARFVAYSILIENPAESITGGKTYSDPAPLPPLLNRLIQPVKTNGDAAPSEGSVFVINDATDYTMMKFYLYILGVATTNIKSYVELQMDQTRKRSAMTSEMKAATPEVEKDLDLLETLLEELHASINDLRAAHLDRSRAKAVVKQLQMRIHYQHIALERTYRLNAPKSIMQQFLSKGKAEKASKPA